jgi:glycerophosphoryl diester phosphodiesterase
MVDFKNLQTKLSSVWSDVVPELRECNSFFRRRRWFTAAPQFSDTLRLSRQKFLKPASVPDISVCEPFEINVNHPDSNSVVLERSAEHRPLIIGHRGYCAVAPENTLPSFLLALNAGADLVELDYHETKDGVPLVIHDDTLDRTTDARKRWRRRRIRVAGRTAAEIQTLDAGNWFDKKFAGARTPLLAEALDLIGWCGGLTVIEHKSGDSETLARLLRERNAVHKVVVISFDWAFLLQIHRREPDLLLGALGRPERMTDGRKPSRLSRKLDARWLEELQKTGARLAVWNRQVPEPAIRLAHEQGLNVWVYTVDETRVARRLTGIGVDGIITNRPLQIRRALSK